MNTEHLSDNIMLILKDEFEVLYAEFLDGCGGFDSACIDQFTNAEAVVSEEVL